MLGVPRRTTDFQELITLLVQTLGEDRATPSAMVRSKVPGVGKREVDIRVQNEVDGLPVYIGFEVSESKSRPKTVEWVERMRGKHEHLSTSKLVLVSSSGFTKGALKLAEYYEIEAITPGEVWPGFVGEIVNNLTSFWLETLNFTAEEATIRRRLLAGNQPGVQATDGWLFGEVEVSVYVPPRSVERCGRHSGLIPDGGRVYGPSEPVSRLERQSEGRNAVGSGLGWRRSPANNEKWGEHRMPAMKYLRFYLDRDCVIVPGWGQTKKIRKGCSSWKLADTRRNVEMLKYNAKVVNGTGGLLIIDVDPKNGGSVKALRRRFPDLPDTRTVQTVTPHPDGFGTHLIFTIPEHVRVSRRQLGTGIDVPPAVMLPGSVVRCDDGVRRRYELINEVEPAPAPLALIAAVAKGDDSWSVTPVDRDDDGSDETVDFLVGRFAAAGPGQRHDTFLQVAPTVIRLKGSEGAGMLRRAYPGDDDEWLEVALKGAIAKFVGAAAPNTRRPSRYVTEALRHATQESRYGKWDAAGGATDRKVLLALLRMCETRQRMTTLASVRALALLTGLEPKTVGIALARLLESGRLYTEGNGPDGTTEYAPIVRELTTVCCKGETPPTGDPYRSPA